MSEIAGEVEITAADGQLWALREAWTEREAVEAAGRGLRALSRREVERVAEALDGMAARACLEAVGRVKAVMPGSRIVEVRR